MKTEKKFRFQVNLNLLMVLLVTVTFLAALSSCGKSNKAEESLAQLAPPPPPPPPPPAADEIYVNVDEMPVFKDGDAGILTYIGKNSIYPEEAKLNNITGKVIVRFVVEKDCSISNVEILQGVNPMLDAEALRVVKTLPKFDVPAKKGGDPVRVSFVIPIIFTLK